MPWPTTSGMRNLAGAEAELVRGAIGMMVDTLVTEMRGEDAPGATGIEWFDQWDCRQRLWLLECVTSAFFGAETIESKAAIFVPRRMPSFLTSLTSSKSKSNKDRSSATIDRGDKA